MTDRSDVIDKIRALRAKAADHAATEAEAMTAAEMAARLLVKHDIKPEELAEVAKSEGTISGFRQGKVLHPVADYTSSAISSLTETKAYTEDGELKYIGLEEDVLMAVYLTEMLVGAAKRGWIDHAEKAYSRIRKKAKMDLLRTSYYMGFARRVSTRIRQLKAERDAARVSAQGTSNSSALVVVKSEIINRKMEEMGLELVERHAGQVHLDPLAVMAGMAQGDQVNLGRPFAGNTVVQEVLE